MRIALDQALGPPSPSYTTGLAQNQPILAAHIQELRNRVLAAWNSGSGGIDVRWLVTDQLGTPRMIFDQTGNFTSVSRHDYLPFGEELSAGGRTGNGYTNSGNTRQKFTGYERDDEVKLDFAQARYYSNSQGRFTGPDPLMASAEISEPQSWNRYSYVINNPLSFSDPAGMDYHIGGGVDEGAQEHKKPVEVPVKPPSIIEMGPLPPGTTVKVASATAIPPSPSQQGVSSTFGGGSCGSGAGDGGAAALESRLRNGLRRYGDVVLSTARNIVQHTYMADGFQVKGSALWVFNINITVSKDLDVFGGVDTPNVSEIVRTGFKSVSKGKIMPFSASATNVIILKPNVRREQRQAFFGGPAFNVSGGAFFATAGYTRSGGVNAINIGAGTPGIDIGESFATRLRWPF